MKYRVIREKRPLFWKVDSIGLGGDKVHMELYVILNGYRNRIESLWGRDFPPVQTGPGVHPASCIMGTGSFPEVKCSGGVLLTTHPLLAPRSWKSRAIPLPPSGPQPGL